MQSNATGDKFGPCKRNGVSLAFACPSSKQRLHANLPFYEILGIDGAKACSAFLLETRLARRANLSGAPISCLKLPAGSTALLNCAGMEKPDFHLPAVAGWF